MKKLILLTGVLLMFISVSCSSDNEDDLISDPPSSTITYTNTIRGIVSGNCTSCHGNPTANNAPMSLTTYDNVKDAVQNRNLITRIENGTMPPNGSLSASQVQSFKTWQTNGFME